MSQYLEMRREIRRVEERERAAGVSTSNRSKYLESCYAALEVLPEPIIDLATLPGEESCP